jgi:hypothetical protein
MKIEKFQLHGKTSVCVGAFQLLSGRAPAQLRGNIAHGVEFLSSSWQFLS